MIKYGNIFNNDTVHALINLKSQKMGYEDKIIFKKFCNDFDAERKIVLEVMKPSFSKFKDLKDMKTVDPEALKEVNEIFSKDSEIKPLPFRFKELIEKSDLSLKDEELLLQLVCDESLEIPPLTIVQ